MSVSEPSGVMPEVSTVRWAGWALVGAGTVSGLARILQPGPFWSAALLVFALAALAVAGRAPEAFQITSRGGSRKFNPVVGAPALFLLLIGLTVQVDDFTLPAAGAAVGAAVLLMLSMRALGRPGLASPLTYQITMAVLGAAAGYGAIVTADVDYDHSPPAVLPTQVLAKHWSSGRSGRSYRLLLPPFGDRRATSSLTVNSATYDGLKPGDLVCVVQHHGALGLAWVTARLC